MSSLQDRESAKIVINKSEKFLVHDFFPHPLAGPFILILGRINKLIPSDIKLLNTKTVVAGSTQSF